MGDFCVSLVSKMLTYAKYAPLSILHTPNNKGLSKRVLDSPFLLKEFIFNLNTHP